MSANQPAAGAATPGAVPVTLELAHQVGLRIAPENTALEDFLAGAPPLLSVLESPVLSSGDALWVGVGALVRIGRGDIARRFAAVVARWAAMRFGDHGDLPQASRVAYLSAIGRATTSDMCNAREKAWSVARRCSRKSAVEAALCVACANGYRGDLENVWDVVQQAAWAAYWHAAENLHERADLAYAAAIGAARAHLARMVRRCGGAT